MQIILLTAASDQWIVHCICFRCLITLDITFVHCVHSSNLTTSFSDAYFNDIVWKYIYINQFSIASFENRLYFDLCVMQSQINVSRGYFSVISCSHMRMGVKRSAWSQRCVICFWCRKLQIHLENNILELVEKMQPNFILNTSHIHWKAEIIRTVGTNPQIC